MLVYHKKGLILQKRGWGRFHCQRVVKKKKKVPMECKKKKGWAWCVKEVYGRTTQIARRWCGDVSPFDCERGMRIDPQTAREGWWWTLHFMREDGSFRLEEKDNESHFRFQETDEDVTKDYDERERRMNEEGSLGVWKSCNFFGGQTCQSMKEGRVWKTVHHL